MPGGQFSVITTPICWSKLDYHFYVDGPSPPNTGDVVVYSISEKRKNARCSAIGIKIIGNDAQQKGYNKVRSPANSQTVHVAVSQKGYKNVQSSMARKLQGFPCVRGPEIKGFVVSQIIERITVGRGFLSYGRRSANEARDDLIEKAKRLGANAIINFVWHNDRQREKGFFGGHHNIDNFWAEGEAVILVPQSKSW